MQDQPGTVLSHLLEESYSPPLEEECSQLREATLGLNKYGIPQHKREKEKKSLHGVQKIFCYCK